jgi:hypothetical protein
MQSTPKEFCNRISSKTDIAKPIFVAALEDALSAKHY